MENKKKPIKEGQHQTDEKTKLKIAELEKKSQEYLEGWKRERADFENYRKREIERVAEVVSFEKSRIFIGVLQVLDNLQRAKEHLSQDLLDSEWGKGIGQIENQIIDFFKKEEVKEIDCLGKEFDPNFHEAVQEEQRPDFPSGQVCEVLEKGYLMCEKLLRPAKVKVNK